MPQRWLLLLCSAFCSLALLAIVGPAQATFDPYVTNGPLLDTGYQLDSVDGTSQPTHYYVDNRSRFALNGASYTYTANSRSGAETLMRHRSDGVNSKIAAIPAGYSIDTYDWSEDGASLWAVLGATGSGESLWRIVPGGTHEKIGAVSFANATGEVVGDAHQGGIGYVANNNLYRIDTGTAVKTQLTSCVDLTGCNNRVYEYAIDRASDGRWLVQFHTATPDGFGNIDQGPSALGWLAADGSFLSTIFEFDGSSFNNVAVMVSPDGKQILMEGNDGDVEFDHVLGSTQRLYGSHVDWQPCPRGVCASFHNPVRALRAPRIGAAVNGAVGGTSTAKAKWSAPTSTGGAAITGYTVQARKLNSANVVVSTKNALRPSSARSYSMRLAKGRYRFRVLAVTRAGKSAWSSSSNIVRAR